MVSRCSVDVLDWSRPEIFWTVFHGRGPRIIREIAGEGNPQVTGITQDVVLAVAQDFQQAPSGVLPGAAPGARSAGDPATIPARTRPKITTSTTRGYAPA